VCHVFAYGENDFLMADITSLMADIKSSMATIKRPMANIASPMANIRLLMAKITSRYGENYSGTAKALKRAS
jgi:hypothetical protein